MSYDTLMQKLQLMRMELNNCIVQIAELQDDHDTLLLENEQQREILNEVGTKGKRKLNNS